LDQQFGEDATGGIVPGRLGGGAFVVDARSAEGVNFVEEDYGAFGGEFASLLSRCLRQPTARIVRPKFNNEQIENLNAQNKSVSLTLPKQTPDTRLTLPYEFTQNVAGADAQKRRSCLTSHGLGQFGLAAAGWAVEQN
jgi:hypothetical protein